MLYFVQLTRLSFGCWERVQSDRNCTTSHMSIQYTRILPLTSYCFTVDEWVLRQLIFEVWCTNWYIYIYIYELIASFLEIYSYKLDGQMLSWTENKIQLKSRTLLIVCQYHESNIFFNGKHSICNNDCSLRGYVKLYIAICSFFIWAQ